MKPRQSHQIVDYSTLMQRAIEQTLQRTKQFTNVFGEAVVAPDGLNFEGLARGDYYAQDGMQINIEDYAWMLTNARPHLWANMNLKEPDSLAPYEFWHYQLASVNYRHGDVIHKDGAEVGKTREIITQLLWSVSTLHNLELLDVYGKPMRRVSSLVGAPLQGHLSDIIDAIDEQIEMNPHLKAMCKKGWHKKGPYHKMTFTHGDGLGIIDFRPAGISGAAWRGIHVNAFALRDEAALLKNEKHESEWKRALKPTATARDYSVPDGDRDCAFYRKAQNALPYDQFVKRYPRGYTGKGKPPRVLFNWAKTQMPQPFWSDERRREYIQDFGGEDSPGYQQNVLGRDGDRANAVFPFATLKPVLVDIPEFRKFKMLANKTDSSFSYELMEYKRMGDAEGEEIIIREIEEQVIQWNDVDEWRGIAERVVMDAFGHLRQGNYWVGTDLGLSQDPTEIIVAEQRGGILRRVARLHLKGVDYHIQAEFIRAVDILLDSEAARNIWGIDQGSAGVAVIGQLHTDERYADRRFDERLLGMQFGAAYESLDLNGECVMDKKTDKPMRVNGKELGSDLLSLAMQQRKAQYPLDPEMVQIYTSQVFTQGTRWRRFKNKNDHLVDADRMLIMNFVLSDHLEASGGFDGFASGASKR